MSAKNLIRPAILMVLLVVGVIGGWEIHLREKGISIAYDENAALWADKRAMVYEPADKADVFIGSSRSHYDIDIEAWERLTGRHAVQLSLDGTNPIIFLEDLANDPRFKGKLIVDVMELLYFNDNPDNSDKPREYLGYFRNESPAQRASELIDQAVESQLVFLDKYYSLNNLIRDEINIPNRPGVPRSGTRFPVQFSRQDLNRQMKMTSLFVADTAAINQVTTNWRRWMGEKPDEPAPKVDPLRAIIQRSATAVEKIRARGGEVVYIRTPSSDKFWAMEQVHYPRAKYWDPLLEATHCQGYFFTDYPGLSRYVPVEWSHLKQEDARSFTTELIKLLPVSFTGNPKI